MTKMVAQAMEVVYELHNGELIKKITTHIQKFGV